jgi:thioredoxin reductase (NADPH)
MASAVPRPVLLSVDDDREVLRAVERDLRQHYGDRYRILAAESGAAALDLLRRLKQRGDAVALMLVDQRMPQMSGVAFLQAAQQLYPDARRVLLTAYADTDAAIHAINDARIQHYLLKPWDPPERELYPVLDDLLGDWQASFRPAFSGIRILGARWNPRAYEIRDFLARSHVPYQWVDVETADRDPAVRALLDSLGSDGLHMPTLLFADGSRLVEPTTEQVAEKAGLRMHAEEKFYDVVIVGGGPAGLAAAVYGASEGLRTVMIEREAPGGQAGLSSRIENYLGFPSGLSGADLARRAVTQARRFGVEILAPQEATALRIDGTYRYVTLSDGTEIGCHTLLLATGVQWRKLDVDGIDRFHGAGVYYGGAITEAMSCEGEDIFIVGGANSAGQAAMYFARYARRVVMLVRGNSLGNSMSQYLIDEIKETPNIHVELNSRITAVHGGERLAEISVFCSQSGETSTMAANSVFIFIGALPRTDWLEGVVDRDELGFIRTGPELVRGGRRPAGWTLDRDPLLLEASVPGVFAVGDVRRGSVKRVASSVGEGSVAIQFVHQYLAGV